MILLYPLKDLDLYPLGMRYTIEGERFYPTRRFQAYVAEIKSDGNKTLLQITHVLDLVQPSLSALFADERHFFDVNGAIIGYDVKVVPPIHNPPGDPPKDYSQGDTKEQIKPKPETKEEGSR